MIGAGITVAAGTRLALLLILVKGFKVIILITEPQKSPVLLLLFTIFPSWEWVICTAAAFLGCSSCFSGYLSVIEPWFCYPWSRNLPLKVDRADISMKCRCHKGQRLAWGYLESPKRMHLSLNFLFSLSLKSICSAYLLDLTCLFQKDLFLQPCFHFGLFIRVHLLYSSWGLHLLTAPEADTLTLHCLVQIQSST